MAAKPPAIPKSRVRDPDLIIISVKAICATKSCSITIWISVPANSSS